MRDLAYEKYYDGRGDMCFLLSNSAWPLASHDTDYEAAFRKDVVKYWMSFDWKGLPHNDAGTKWSDYLTSLGYGESDIVNIHPCDIRLKRIPKGTEFFVLFNEEGCSEWVIPPEEMAHYKA